MSKIMVRLLVVSGVWCSACSLPGEPNDITVSLSAESRDSTVRLFVDNATCATGSCSPIRILGFPDNQPRTPGGFWSIDLGVIRGASACFTLPKSREFRVTAYPSGQTTTISWTPSLPLSLAAEPDTASIILASPTTPSFLPASSRGWNIRLPGSGGASTAAPCTP